MRSSINPVLLSMSPQLRQINVSYVDSEDRLLLRVSTSEDAEYRIWCTRRFTRLMLDRFETLFQEDVAVTVPAASGARREVAQMQHGLSVSEDAFSKTYEASPESYPLGEAGLLVTTLKYKKLENSGMQLQLTDGADKGMGFSLTQAMQHQLYELLLRAVGKADWFADRSETAAAALPGAQVH